MTRPDPLTAPAATAPDADYDGLRAAIVARIAELAGATWTDQNEADPGITLAEAAAWGLADGHYRVSMRGLDSWPLSLLLAAPSPRLSGAPGFADVLAEGAPPLAWDLVDRVERASTRGEAQGLLVDHGLTASDADSAAGLLRRDLLRRVALDRSATVHAAVDEAAAGLPAGTTETVVDAAAVRLLRQDPELSGLWPDEIDALVARERERRAVAAVTDAAPALRSATGAELAALVAGLVARGVPAEVADLATAFRPGAHAPEYWEDADGGTRVWPPTPDQSLRCEPVTGEDYAVRARAVAGVRRAWAVAGALPGIAWHGGATVVTDRWGTVTVLVERAGDEGGDESGDESGDDFLRRVLAEVLGESDAPWSALGARRMLGDEVGAALVRHHPVAVAAVLHTPVGVDTAAVVAGARARVAAYLAAGRPHRRSAATGPGRGPWPDAPQPPTGWEPGEAIPVTELVQVLADDPVVLGVSDVSATVRDGPVLRDPVRVCATTPVGTGPVDGVTLAAGDRFLLTAQSSPVENGVYVVNDAGGWSRAPDLATGDSQCLSLVRVTAGTLAGTVWAQTGDVPPRLGQDPVVWARSDHVVLPAVRVVATTPVTPAGQQRLSGVRLFAGDRVLLTAQATGDGVYVVAAGGWTRAGTEPDGAVTRVDDGADAGATWWLSGTTWRRGGAAQPPGDGPSGDIRIPAGAVPYLAAADCLRVRLTIGPEAADAEF